MGTKAKSASGNSAANPSSKSAHSKHHDGATSNDIDTQDGNTLDGNTLDINTVTLWGWLATDPDIRAFESGSRLASLLVTTRTEYERPRTDVVPVTVWSPGEDVSSARRGDRVRVEGMVQRRFWTGVDGRTSRVEVVASSFQIDRQSQ